MRSVRRAIALAVAPLALGAGLLAAGCSHDPPAADATEAVATTPRDATPSALRFTYPQEGTLFPPESVAPTFIWEGGGDAARWDVVVRDSAGAEVLKDS